MAMMQKVDERLILPDIDEEDSVEILELGAIRKPVEVNGINAAMYFFDGVWFTQNMTE